MGDVSPVLHPWMSYTLQSTQHLLHGEVQQAEISRD